MSADPFSRRQVLTGAAATAFAVPALAGDAATARATEPGPSPVPAAGGGPSYELRCGFMETTFDGRRVRLRAYNAQVPGPMLTVRPGETLRVRLANELPRYDSRGWNGNHNVPHRLDATNLHVHGMDVRPHLFEPLGTSDPAAPMIAVGPGETLDYAFEVPADHPPGLYWYHPHHHGSTAVQAVSGMAGPIIVRGVIDEVPEIKAALEIALVVQDIGLFPSETVPGLWCYEPQQNAMWQTFGGNVTRYDPKTGKAEPTNLKGGFTTGDYALRYFLLNGQPFFKETHNPDPKGAQSPVPTQLPPQRIRIRPGEVVRFRMLNGNSDNLMPIVVDGHQMHLIALDGVNFAEVRTIPVHADGEGAGQVLLAPANRAEFLIRGSSTPGIYRIRQLAQAEQFLLSAEKTICEIEVTGTPVVMKLPTRLPPPTRNYPLIRPAEIKAIRTIQFGGNFPGVVNPVVGIDFLINNMQYQDPAIPTVVNLGDAEEWHLVVEGPHHGGTEGHPFHIHVVSFEVISLNGVLQPPGTFQDTIWVAAKTTAVIRMRFKQWIGKSVFHCHILPHEDTGMMQNFLIVDQMAAHRH
ncbi:multicopper oxidase family protein [Sphingomonas sp. NFX23]|uniref:multicopper oxidase family protein n=1 Tax=Sphingomonas sp. NFX23 TaxID=2819532 RepID=UPI003CFAB3D4